MKKRVLIPLLFCLIAVLFLGFNELNRWIKGEMGLMGQTPTVETIIRTAPPAPKAPPPKPAPATGDVIRKTRLAPERTFEHNTYYQGGVEIATSKTSLTGLVYDLEGAIPNGKVKFINETDRTSGVEYYRENLRHGSALVRYEDGRLKEEAEYQFGRLVSLKEYFHDGTLKMEADYSDARQYTDDRDVGEGKLYSRDGQVQYEWYLVNRDPNGYYKFYNRQGRMTGAVYFDRDGNEVTPYGGQSARAEEPPEAPAGTP